jgi:aspartokinase/homoserine dehydrogenase 1
MPRRNVQVHKFGGASLADTSAIRHAAEIVLSHRPGPVVVVASAMAGVTDQLLALGAEAAAGSGARAPAVLAELRARHLGAARAVARGAERTRLTGEIATLLTELERLLEAIRATRELTPRTSDHLVARGERMSARLLAAELAGRGARARYVDALELVRTDGAFGGASPDLAATDAAARATLRPILARGAIPVVPGFIGRAPGGEVATLGRGSDLTAALLARALGAESVSLWKDVPGLLTADPRVVPDAQVIAALHAREAAELAYYGAKVLHPRALTPLAGRRIPLRIRPFGDPAVAGTEVSERAPSSRSPVRALSAAPGQALVTVSGNGMLGVPGIAERTFAAMHAERVSVALISQASSEHSICFTVPAAGAERARRALLREFTRELAGREIDGVEVRTGVATLAVVGLGMAGTPGVAARVFGALANAGINIIGIAQGSSELNISLVVDGREAPEAQRRVHDAFQLGKIGGGAVGAPAQVSAVLLGFGNIGRALADMVARLPRGERRVAICGLIDRSGYVFDPEGLSARRLAQLTAGKADGRPLAALPGGRAAAPAASAAHVARHALTRPVLVDLTADATLPILTDALEAGLDVVTANKRPLVEHRSEEESLIAVAARRHRRVLYEATVGAGLPVVYTARTLVATGDRVTRIEGCLSGTLGYLLTAVEEGHRFSDAVRTALALGYTEPDPRDDLSGTDVARKAVILGRILGFGGSLADAEIESLVPAAMRRLPPKAFLARLPALDDGWARRVAEARAAGGALRYVGTVTPRSVRVGLVAVPARHPFASLRGTDNRVVFHTARYHTQPLVVSGPGAGAAVTAAGVLGDLMTLLPA